jgi:hypothetical protein
MERKAVLMEIGELAPIQMYVLMGQLKMAQRLAD